MKKIIKILFWICLYLFVLNANAQIVYPIQTMSKPECRFQNYSSLWSDCIQNLPILKTKDYITYKNDYNIYRRIYTVLWWASYTYWWDVWYGWHSWVDIATAKWTPVYSITDWTVLYAWNVAWRWNVVKISHIINWKTIYSWYAHLSKIDVKVWDKVLANTKIWEVWSTWNSTWNHLHFEIDTTSSNVLWYRKKCSEKNYNNIINNGTCYSELSENTVDPLLFLETSWAIITSPITKKEKIDKNWLLSNEEILKREINEFLQKYEITINLKTYGWNIAYWQSANAIISVIDKRTKAPFNGTFPAEMTFKYDNKKINIFPTGILLIEKWIRDFLITPKSLWNLEAEVFIWKVSIKKFSFWVYDNKTSLTPNKAIVNLEEKNFMGEIKKAKLYFVSKEWINILWVPFNWDFYLSSSDNSLQFCIKKVKSLDDLDVSNNINCNEMDFNKSVKFSYKDMIEWNLIFNYKTSSPNITNLEVKNIKWEKLFTKSITPLIPLWIDKNHLYYNEVIKMSWIWVISWIRYWYVLPDNELEILDSIYYLKNTLYYLKTKCNNKSCNDEIDKKISILKRFNNEKLRWNTLTRLQFIKLVKVFLPVKTSNISNYKDLNINEKILVSSVIWETLWKDSFWKNGYFQPNKKITRAEWAYIISKLIY